MVGLPYGEEIMIVGRTMLTQCTSVTDGRTDGQNYDHKDRATVKTMFLSVCLCTKYPVSFATGM